jgi:hypothetical protein
MRASICNLFALLMIALFVSENACAQPKTGKHINAAVGYGISAP